MWSNISSPPNKKQVVASEVKQENGTSNNLAMLQNATTNHANNDAAQQQGGSPLMRYKHAVCSAPSGYIYIHGGRFGNLPLDDDIWRFDPHQNTWLQLKTRGCKPPNLQEHTLVEHNEHLYLFGGQVSASDTENSFWSLDLLSGEWRSLSMISSKFGAHLGPTNRRGHSAVIHGDSMYIYGGFEDFRGSSNQLWEYNLATGRWELRNLSASSACQPEPRHSHSAIVHKDSMYVFGGLSNLKPLGDLWRWSWREKRWFRERTRGQSPGQLHGHTAVQAFDSMFVFGGERNGRPTRSLWRLNLSNMSWQKIRPKGPKPSPTTWHGAIANPLSILDEANYIVQGPDSSSELMIGCSRESCSSMQSENCFVQNTTVPVLHHHHHHQRVIRPRSPNSSSVMPKSSSSAEVMSHLNQAMCNNPRSSSMLLHQVNGNIRGAKRKSRLSFLRRNRHIPKSSTAYELKQMPESASASKLDATRHFAGSAQVQCVKQEVVEPETNVRILDNLDSDIKEMFQRAELSPSPEKVVHANEEPMSVDFHPGAISASTTCRSSYYETARQPSSDIALNGSYATNARASQRTSCASYTTPPSELNTLTENLPNDRRLATEQHSFLWSADSNQGSGYDRRNNRPKSEIVQSLIERADARIKHLYTPYFSNQAQGDNKPSLGRGRHNKNRHSLERTKRHTMPETMTYYNLYFSEDKSSSSPTSSGQEGDLNQRLRQNSMTRDDLSSSTLRAIGSARSYAAAAGGAGAGAALVGIHDGCDLSNKESQLSLVTTNSSGSRTICDAETPYSTQAALTYNTQTGDEHDDDKSTMKPTMLAQNNHVLRPDTAESCDNTSLSFSVINEFEEDDMLQYSSPTDPKLEFSPMATNHRQTVLYNERPQRSSEYLQHVYQSTDEQVHEGREPLAPKSNSSGYDSISTSSDQHQSATKNQQVAPKSSFGGHSDHDDSRALSLSPADYTTTETSPEQSALKSHLKKLKPNKSQVNEPVTTTASSTTADSLALTSEGGFDGPSSPSLEQQRNTQAKSLPPSSPPDAQQALISATRRRNPLRSKLFSKQKAKTRYWQLCMFVIGGKQGGAHGVNEPITIWRLYI